jgi:septum formation protein
LSNLHLLLASASPRRAQLLQAIGLPFTLVPTDIAEPDPSAEEERQPAHYVERLARMKAAACDVDAALGVLSTGGEPHAIVLAADTTVWHDGHILNKPSDAEHAIEMLTFLRGKTHHVYTGVCLRVGEEYLVEHETTAVHFAPLGDEWIRSYVATGEPLDKAGAYGAQGVGALLVDRIEGDYWNVVGLPLARLSRMLERIGHPVEAWWRANGGPVLTAKGYHAAGAI